MDGRLAIQLEKNKSSFGSIKNKFLNPGDYYSYLENFRRDRFYIQNGRCSSCCRDCSVKKNQSNVENERKVANIYNKNLERYKFIKLIKFKKKYKTVFSLV